MLGTARNTGTPLLKVELDEESELLQKVEKDKESGDMHKDKRSRLLHKLKKNKGYEVRHKVDKDKGSGLHQKDDLAVEEEPLKSMSMLEKFRECRADMGRRLSVGRAVTSGDAVRRLSVGNLTSTSSNKEKAYSLVGSLPRPGRKSHPENVSSHLYMAMVGALLADPAHAFEQQVSNCNDDASIQVMVGGGGEMGNKAGGQSQSEEETEVVPPASRVPPLSQAPGGATGTSRSVSVENGEEGELEMELPPPMKVLDQHMSAAAAQGGTGPSSVVTGGPLHPPLDNILPDAPNRSSSLSLKAAEGTTTDLATEIENIVKEKMEQHSETSERLKEWVGSADGCSGDEASSPLPSATAILTAELPLSDDGDLGASALPDSANVQDSSPGDCDMTKEQRHLHKRQFVITELVETERIYVRYLADVVEGYLMEMRNPESEIKMPDDLKDGKDKMVFGNLEAIYEWHRDFFMKNIERSIEHPEEIGSVFQRSEKRLQIYVKYCQNKPTSEYIVSEHLNYFEELRQKCGHKLQLPDLLIKPVQRMMKYQLLLRDILKHTERAGLHEQVEPLKRALNVMIVVPKAANDMMNVGRLQGFEGKIMAQGKLLLYGPLASSEGASGLFFRGKDLMVFLFEQSIIFSESRRKKNQFSNPVYAYKSHLQVNKMSLEESCDDGDPLKFVLKSTDPRNPHLAFTCQGASDDDRNQWVSQIRHLLQTQKDFLKAIQSPIAYQMTQKNTSDLQGQGASWNCQLRKSFSQPSTELYLEAAKKKSNTLESPNRGQSQGDPGRSMPTPIVSITSPMQSPESKPPPPPPIPPALPVTSGLPSYIPVRKESSAGRESPSSPIKPKKNFFDGFKNTLRPRVKPEGKSADDVDSLEHLSPLPRHDREDFYQRRWSESASPSKAGEWNVPLPAGTLVKVLADFTALREDEISVTRGEVIQVITSNALRGYLVHRPASSSSPAAEGWVAASVLLPSAFPDLPTTPPASPTHPSNQYEQQGKKHWIKFRKPSFSKREHPPPHPLRREETVHELPSVRSQPHLSTPSKQMTVSLINPYHPESPNSNNTSFRSHDKPMSGCIPASPESPVRVLTPLRNVTVCPGEPAEMVCVITGTGLWVESTTISWTGPHGPLTDPRFEIEQHRDGTLRLHVGSCRVTDAGEYMCTISCGGHSISCSARINLAQGKTHAYSNGHS